MASGKFGKYIVRTPIYEDVPNEASGDGAPTGVTPGATFMSAVQVPDARLHIMWGVAHAVPKVNPYVVAHDHDYDEVLFFCGFGPSNTRNLGAVVELALEDEVYVIDSTCTVYIPAGMRHCPITVKTVSRPYGLAAICLSGRYATMGYTTPPELALS